MPRSGAQTCAKRESGILQIIPGLRQRRSKPDRARLGKRPIAISGSPGRNQCRGLGASGGAWASPTQFLVDQRRKPRRGTGISLLTGRKNAVRTRIAAPVAPSNMRLCEFHALGDEESVAEVAGELLKLPEVVGGRFAHQVAKSCCASPINVQVILGRSRTSDALSARTRRVRYRADCAEGMSTPRGKTNS